MTKCADRLRRYLTDEATSPQGAALRAGLHSLLEEEGAKPYDAQSPTAQEAALRKLAAKFLWESCVGHTAPVVDFPAAAMAVHTALVAGDPKQILTDKALQALLDHFPGGIEFLRAHGGDAIRTYLAANGLVKEPNRFLANLGVSELAPFLTSNLLHDGVLDAANRVLANKDHHLRHLIFAALMAEMTPTEQAARLACVTKLSAGGLAAPSGPLLMPSLTKAEDAFKAYYAKQHTVWPQVMRAQAQDVLLALFPARWRTRSVYSGGSHPDLRQLIWLELCCASGLPFYKNSVEGNQVLLDAAVGGLPAADAVKAYPQLRHLVRGHGSRRPTQRPRVTLPRTPQRLSNPAKVLTHLTSLAKSAGGRLPNKLELGRDLSHIETTMCSTYTELTEALITRRGFKRPGRSSNEVFLDHLITDAFGDDVKLLETEWSSEIYRGAHRADIYTVLRAGTLDNGSLDIEVIWEADGQGHFEKVYNWSLPKQRAHDADKADDVGKAYHSGREIMHVAVHHAALSESRVKLDAAQLRHIVTDAHAAGNWWVYIRPVGCTQLREAPGHVEDFPGSWDTTVVVQVLTDPTLGQLQLSTMFS